MNIVQITRTFAVALVLVLTATGLWAGAAEEAPAAAADKRYVTDPVTGKVYSAPEYGGTLTVGAIRMSPDKDPFSNWTTDIMGSVIEKMGMVDWAIDRDTYPFIGGYPAPLYALKGALAESWEQPDDKTIVLHIRQNVHFHDKAPVNGREVTADDVEYNFHRLLGLGKFTDAGPNPHASVATLTSIPWESVTATDKWTVVFKLKEPRLRALNHVLETHQTGLQAREVIEQHEEYDWRNLVGTGPFMLTDVVEGTSFSLTKNPDYWGYDEKYPENRLPYVDETRFLVIPEVATRLAALRSAKIDFIGEQGGGLLKSVDQVVSLQRTNPELVIHQWALRADTGTFLNPSEPPYDDIRVRKAMQMALDVETMNDTYYKGYSDTIPRGRVGRGMKGAFLFEEWPEELKKGYTYDAAGAEALLDEAGYPRGDDGMRFKTTMLAWPFHDLNLVELQAAYWREIGVDVDLDVTADGAQLVARQAAADFGMTVLNNGTEADPATAVSWYWSGHPRNAVVRDPQYDAMYDALLAVTTYEEETRLIGQMDRHALENFWHLWAAPMSPWFTVHQPWVMGYNSEGAFGGGQYHVVFSRLWIDGELKESMGH